MSVRQHPEIVLDESNRRLDTDMKFYLILR